jgi:hypothetical protein
MTTDVQPNDNELMPSKRSDRSKEVRQSFDPRRVGGVDGVQPATTMNYALLFRCHPNL